jgi:hypothetical protein
MQTLHQITFEISVVTEKPSKLILGNMFNEHTCIITYIAAEILSKVYESMTGMEMALEDWRDSLDQNNPDDQ